MFSAFELERPLNSEGTIWIQTRKSEWTIHTTKESQKSKWSQWSEHSASNVRVMGSNPHTQTQFYSILQHKSLCIKSLPQNDVKCIHKYQRLFFYTCHWSEITHTNIIWCVLTKLHCSWESQQHTVFHSRFELLLELSNTASDITHTFGLIP